MNKQDYIDALEDVERWSKNIFRDDRVTVDIMCLELSSAKAIKQALQDKIDGGWQDISTVPKDGTKIDLWCKFELGYRRATNSYYDNSVESWMFGDTGFYEGQYEVKPIITHWKHIDNPPQEEEK